VASLLSNKDKLFGSNTLAQLDITDVFTLVDIDDDDDDFHRSPQQPFPLTTSRPRRALQLVQSNPVPPVEAWVEPGPANLLHALRWPVSHLTDVGPDMREQIRFWFDNGLFLKSKYTGCEGFGILMGALQWGLSTFDLPFRFGIVSTEACDIASCSRKLLSQYVGDIAPAHIFADIQSRVPEPWKSRFAALQWPSKAWIGTVSKLELNTKVGNLMDEGWSILQDAAAAIDNGEAWMRSACSACSRDCPIEGDFLRNVIIPGENGASPYKGCRVQSAGMCCYDFSNNGDMLGFAGTSAKPFLVCIFDIRVSKTPFFFLECVISMAQLDFLQRCLEDIYDIDSCDICPSFIGHPKRRLRQWISGALRVAVYRTRPLSDCLAVFKKRCVADASMYFVVPDDSDRVRAVVNSFARQQCKVAAASDAPLTMRDVLPEWERAHVDWYEDRMADRIASGRLERDAAFVCDTRQNPFEHEVCGSHMPTLTRTARRYSFKDKRCLLSVEAFGSLNFALSPLLDAIAEGQCSEAEAYQARQCWRAPAAIADLNESMGMQFAGNGFSLACGGAIVAWTFATCVPAGVMSIGRQLPSFAADQLAATYNFGDSDDEGAALEQSLRRVKRRLRT
jgi:hypothetical protein